MSIKNLLFSGATALLVILCAVPALAHVEGHMPDSVAEMEYRILLEFKPRDFAIRVKLATVLMNQDKLAEAEEEFYKALGSKPRDLQAHIGLTRLKLRQNKISDALAMIMKAVDIDPDSAIVYLYYGLTLEADKRPREAMQMYRLGLSKLEDNSSDPEELHEREQLQEALGKLEASLTKSGSNK
jgi:tetratricopeptide (TPR) repeat protein